MTENILLDSSIRDWVVLPLFVIMVAAGLLRMEVGKLLQAKPKNQTRIQQRAQFTARMTSAIKGGAFNYMPTSAFQARSTAYPKILTETAAWCDDTIARAEAERQAAASEDDDDMPNPLAAMEGMMGNMAFMVQNMIMMQAIQHFFSGFILLKVPFALTMGFKQMFQRGLEGLATLDTSYVSSVSWYFLVMFGLRGFFKLVVGVPPLEQLENGKMLMMLGKRPGGGPPSGPDDDTMAKMLTTEAENLELMLPKKFKSNFDSVEKRLLKNRYPKKSRAVGKTGDDFLLQAAGGGSSKSKKAKKTN
eukprot:CAMPEP_0119553914 /NCGR_PEP_ID=MMETSP1352-20130426/6532_1 /TAXON_ID=265584 /ORGANISM="Stauroneis constricta, Strain CCMP1120" /LENGTH=303 /DNA_ID=CAMNT_0007600397 /DNA_START=66 /DNA_END=977 /DNA_ORIENTATION=-